MKNLIKTSVLIIFIFLLTCFSISAQAVPEPYKPIVEKYIKGILNHNEYNKNELGDFGGGVWYASQPSLNDYGFCLIDIDGNGVLELLPRFIPDPYPIAAVYTIENNSAKKLIGYYGGDSNLIITNEIPGYPELSNCVTELKYNDYGPCFYFYKVSGNHLNFNVGYTIISDDKWYRTTNINDPLQSSCSPLPFNVYTYRRELNLIPFSAYNPDAKAVEKAPNGSIYRLFNSRTGEHLFTPNYGEAYYLTYQFGWTYEDIAWNSPSSGDPVYRLYNPGLDDHLYTTNKEEMEILTSQHGWQKDNNGDPLFYSGGSVPIFRLYNPRTGRHHLTKDEGEYNILPSYDWQQEGCALNCIS